MRIMQVIARMNVGGPAVIVAELMQGLDPAKFQAQLVTGYCDSGEADYLDEVAPDVPVTRVVGLGRSVSLIGDIKSFYKLINLIKEFRPDVIHTHTAKAGVLGRVTGLIAFPSSKRIHTFHGHLLNGYFPAWKTQLVIFTERFLALISTSLISIGNQVKSDLLSEKIGRANQYSVIFPGLPALEIKNKTYARIILNLEMDKTYLVFVGRLTQIKRPDRLIELARYLKVNHPKVQILIAGAGDKFTETQGCAIQESLPMIFLGWRHDISTVLSASDICILCSDNEGIPLALIQASQAGLPIVSTNVGSVSDIVLNGESGLLTETSSQSLIKALDELLADPLKMDRFGQAGKLRASHLFSLKGMIDAHEKLYSQAIQKIS